MDLCRSLALMKPPASGSKRVAILTLSGGSGIVATDCVAERGLVMAALSDATARSLAELFPEWMPVANPVDLWPAVERQTGTDCDVVGRSARALLADPQVDALFLHAFVSSPRSRPNPAELASWLRSAGKPAVLWTIGRRDDCFAFHKEALAQGIPAFPEITRAADCLAAILSRPRRTEGPPAEPRDAREMSPALLRLLDCGSGPLDEERSKAILGACGIPTVPETIAADPEQALRAASCLGYPVVLKGLVPGAVHKTERGLVRLGLRNGRAVRSAFKDLRGKMDPRGKVLVQKQLTKGVELILGFLRDPQFGPCVMVGLGGLFAELYEDTAFAVAPLTRGEAHALIGRIRGQKMLDGFRSLPPVDRDALARIIVALGEIGLRHGRIREIDINPLIADAQGAAAADATIILT